MSRRSVLTGGRFTRGPQRQPLRWLRAVSLLFAGLASRAAGAAGPPDPAAEAPAGRPLAAVTVVEPDVRMVYSRIETASWRDLSTLLSDRTRASGIASTTSHVGYSCREVRPPGITLTMELTVVVPGPLGSLDGDGAWAEFLRGTVSHELSHARVLLDAYHELALRARHAERCDQVEEIQAAILREADEAHARIDREERVKLHLEPDPLPAVGSHPR